MQRTRDAAEPKRGPRRAPVTFELSRFDWTDSDRLEIAGRWRGVESDELGSPELVVRQGDATLRLAAIASDEPAPPPQERWSVAFALEAGPRKLDAPRLEFPDGKVVELPSLKPSRSRLGRPRFARARASGGTGDDATVTPADVPVAETADEALAAPADDAAPDTPSAEEVLALRAELAMQADQLETLREELERVQEEAARARGEVDRVTQRRRADAERFHEEIGSMRALAEKTIVQERRAREHAELESADAAPKLQSAREEVARLSQDLEGAERARAETEASLESVRQERERLSRELEEARTAQEDVRAQLASAQEASEAGRARERRLRDAVEALRSELGDILDGAQAQGDARDPGA